MEWPAKRVESFEQLVDEIRAIKNRAQGVIWRGQAVASWKLNGTIDRNRPSGQSYQEMLAEEAELIERFCNQAVEHVQQDRVYLVDASTRLGKLTALPMLRHHGVPTRAIDWTHNPMVAAFFAIHDREWRDAEAAIWWFDRAGIHEPLARVWPRIGVLPRTDWPGEHAIEESMFGDPGDSWICAVDYPESFTRMKAQQGLLTVCGKLAMCHDDAINKIARDTERGRLLIPTSVKAQIWTELRSIGFSSWGLELPVLDRLGSQINEEWAKRRERPWWRSKGLKLIRRFSRRLRRS